MIAFDLLIDPCEKIYYFVKKNVFVSSIYFYVRILF